jgi:hypothetical protein
MDNKPFSIVRLGNGPETFLSSVYLKTGQINERYLHPQTKTLYNAGIYTRNNDKEKMKLYCKMYNTAILHGDLLASFYGDSSMEKVQNYYSNKFHIKQIHSRSIEPFHIINENVIPWTHYLKGKTILVINPFVESFKKQMDCGFRIFKDKDIFLDGQEIKYYKSFQTIAGNHIHNDWYETFNIMCNDIKKIDFDIALLGCGGYGLPLCLFIKAVLKKSAIYIGGGIQLLFGVMGKRWENNEMWKKIISENKCKFIRPSGDEICENLRSIEGGCYW